MKQSLPSNLWKSPVIKKRLYQEALFDCKWGVSHEKPHYWCMVPQADEKMGAVTLKNYEASITNADPHEMQQIFARDIMTALQSEAHFDGLWLVGFTHPPSKYDIITDTNNAWGRMIMIWHDMDGDPKYTLESDLPFIEQMEHGVDYYVGLANQAHEQWNEAYGAEAMKRDFNLTEGQTRKAALEALN